MARIKVYTTEQMRNEPMLDIAFRIDPILPATGTCFVHAPTSTGKTVLSVEEAICIANGTSFLGFETTKGRVAFIEVDMPEFLFRQRFKPRIDELHDNGEIRWVFCPAPFDCLESSFLDSEAGRVLQCIQDDFNPDVVIVDTLRKVYTADEKSGEIPSRVYGLFQTIFPNAVIQFNAHDRKASRDGTRGPSREDFSGHQAWLNDAQSGLHLSKGRQEREAYLELTKNQFSDTSTFQKLTLLISDDGCYIDTLDSQRGERISAIIASQPGAKAADLDKLISDELEVSERTARRLRTTLAKASKN